jgi:hypothetical protein
MERRRFAFFALSLMIGGGLATSHGQAQRPTPAATPAMAADPFAGLTFRNIGPATMGGRIDDLAVLESNPAVFYVGAATSGLWKTTNNGTTWEVLFDDIDDAVSIGDIAWAHAKRRVHDLQRRRLQAWTERGANHAGCGRAVGRRQSVAARRRQAAR